jgi:uncharacterized protein (TIGR03067 family)
MKRPKLYRGVATTIMAVFAALAWGGSASHGAQDKSEAKKELEKLQGTWTHLSREEGGKQVVGEAKDIKFVITGDKWTLGRDGESGQAGTLKIVDAASTPKKFDLVITDGPNKGKVVLSVYAVDGDVLKYCGNLEARPPSLQTKPGDGSYCNSYKRLKK